MIDGYISFQVNVDTVPSIKYEKNWTRSRKSLDYKPLGRTGRKISAIGLGCVTFGREIDEPTSIKLMDYAVDNGITFFDTAEAYARGASESIIGRWMKARDCRDTITLCTKVSSGGTLENIPQALACSLERLQTDHLDIYKMHSPDVKTPIAETLTAMTSEVRAGRVHVIGGSNYSAEQLHEVIDASKALNLCRFEMLQPPYNLVLRHGEDSLFPLCSREEISISSYSPLGAGFLMGKYTADRSKFPKGTRFDVAPGHADIYFSEKNFKIVERLHAKAAEIGIPAQRLAMAWAMTNPHITAVLIGVRKPEHIDNALAAYEGGLNKELRNEMSSWGDAV